ncbi:Pol polyprotein [Elysia marginata]|uniref:Pol polyprotein n=1 Tax=Elysia marginata TaxID=1093978 RepID=A0AAV4F4P6_9GAST|nr:Pol polyprotein [Elysia marginata]
MRRKALVLDKTTPTLEHLKFFSAPWRVYYFRHVLGYVNYLDDVYVTGKNNEEHLDNLAKVLAICREKGISLRKDKCEFMQQDVTLVGYRLNKHGILPLDEEIQAIRDAPTSRNTQELRSFLGLINYYGKSIE